MKQAENYNPKYASHSNFDSRETPDSFWKQKRSQSFPARRSNRSMKPVATYYSSSAANKSTKSHVCNSPIYSKYNAIHTSNPLHQQSHFKPGKDKYYSSDFLPTRKTRYDEELGNLEKVKFIDEDLVNFTEDNAAENGEEDETEDDCTETVEYPNKDFEDQETDDEIDEESDVSPQGHRTERGSRNENVLRSQRWRPMEKTDMRRVCCQQHISMMQNHSLPSKCYHTVAEHEVPEPLSEEHFVRATSKSPSRRQSPDYRQWSVAKDETDQYNEDAQLTQTTRRARTKPDFDRLLEAELNRTRRCNRCGNLSSKKGEQCGKNVGGYNDRTNIATKGPIGDEAASQEQAFYSQCNFRHGTKDATMPIDNSSSIYGTKSARRSRDLKSPTIYEIPEQAYAERLTSDYARSSNRYLRKSADAFTEKSKRLIHVPHGTARVPPRYID